MKTINELVRKAISLQSMDDILNINQMQYTKRLTEYFSRVKVSEFNSIGFYIHIRL